MNRIKQIEPSDKSAYIRAKKHWDSIAKPLGSFGILEETVQKIAAVQGTENVDISRRTVVVMCADHGVVCEGVTQCGSEVTAICAEAIAEGTSNVNAVAKVYGADVIAVDVGISEDIDCPELTDRKIAYGTRNMAKGAAMSREETEQAIIVGMDMVKQLKSEGVNLIITGEMGIGNTTSASALAAILTGLPVRSVTGRGAGLTNEGLERKISVIEKAIRVNSPDRNKPAELLQKLGGLEIAGMTGLFLGGAVYKVPVITDGVISAAAAAIAYCMNPICADYMLAGHCSDEPAGKKLLELMGLDAVIYGRLRLGEGTGGLMLLPLLDGALALYNNSHRFAELPMERYREIK